jgi:superfamily II DNA or RNA helicase
MESYIMCDVDNNTDELLKAALDVINSRRRDDQQIYELKDKQKECVLAIGEGDSDVMCILPTGYGKSLVFELLPVYCDLFNKANAATRDVPKAKILVISPLNAIIDQQRSTLGKEAHKLSRGNILFHNKNKDKNSLAFQVNTEDYIISIPLQKIKFGLLFFFFCLPPTTFFSLAKEIR